MRSRAAVGKRIVEIVQERITTEAGTPALHIRAIVLEDGTRLVPSVTELASDYAVEITAFRDGRRVG